MGFDRKNREWMKERGRQHYTLRLFDWVGGRTLGTVHLHFDSDIRRWLVSLSLRDPGIEETTWIATLAKQHDEKHAKEEAVRAVQNYLISMLEVLSLGELEYEQEMDGL